MCAAPVPEDADEAEAEAVAETETGAVAAPTDDDDDDGFCGRLAAGGGIDKRDADGEAIDDDADDVDADGGERMSIESAMIVGKPSNS